MEEVTVCELVAICVRPLHCKFISRIHDEHQFLNHGCRHHFGGQQFDCLNLLCLHR